MKGIIRPPALFNRLLAFGLNTFLVALIINLISELKELNQAATWFLKVKASVAPLSLLLMTVTNPPIFSVIS
jgi:hypothetical protein